MTIALPAFRNSDNLRIEQDGALVAEGELDTFSDEKGRITYHFRGRGAAMFDRPHLVYVNGSSAPERVNPHGVNAG